MRGWTMAAMLLGACAPDGVYCAEEPLTDGYYARCDVDGCVPGCGAGAVTVECDVGGCYIDDEHGPVTEVLCDGGGSLLECADADDGTPRAPVCVCDDRL